MPVLAPNRVQRSRRVREHQFCCAGEEFDDVVEPAVVDGGKVVGLEEGDNPHIWYGPDYVRQISTAVTAELKELAPDAAAYFDEQQTAWQTSMKPYDDVIARPAPAGVTEISVTGEGVGDGPACCNNVRCAGRTSTTVAAPASGGGDAPKAS